VTIPSWSTTADSSCAMQFSSDFADCSNIMPVHGCLALEESDLTVTLVLLDGQSSGLGLLPDFHVQSLRVEAVRRSGMVDDWNLSHPRSKIEKGDYVVKVNQVEGDVNGMLDECSRSAVLEFRVRKKTVDVCAKSKKTRLSSSRATSCRVS